MPLKVKRSDSFSTRTFKDFYSVLYVRNRFVKAIIAYFSDAITKKNSRMVVDWSKLFEYSKRVFDRKGPRGFKFLFLRKLVRNLGIVHGYNYFPFYIVLLLYRGF